MSGVPGANLLCVIDGRTDRVIHVIKVSIDPGAVTVNPRTNTIYVIGTDDDNVYVIDGETNHVRHRIAVA